MAGAAGGADPADDVEDQILWRDAGAERALDAQLHRSGRRKLKRLRGQHMLDLAGADAEGERADAAVSRSVRIAAHDGRSGKREALLGPDDMDDALFGSSGADAGDAEFGGVAPQRGKLRGALGIGDGQLGAIGREARGGGQIVIGDRECQIGAAHPATGRAQALEGLRAGDFVDQVPVDIEEAGAVRAALDEMGVPDLLVERAGAAGHAPGAMPAPGREQDGLAWGAARADARSRCSRKINRAAYGFGKT